MTTLGWIGMAMYMKMLFGLGGIDLLLATASTSTTCCCKHVRNTAATHVTYMNNPNSTHYHPLADLYSSGVPSI